MKTLLYCLAIAISLIACADPFAEPAPGLQPEDISFGNNSPSIDGINYTATNNGVVPTVITLTADTKYTNVLEWSYVLNLYPQQNTLKGPNEPVSFSITTGGSYLFQVYAYRNQAAYDRKDQTQRAFKSVTVTLATPSPTIVDITAGGVLTKLPADITFTCTRSNSTPVNSYSWDFGDGSTAVSYLTDGLIHHVYTRVGSYKVTVTANTLYNQYGTGTFSKTFKIG